MPIIMELTHDPARHLRYLRQSLSQDSEAIGFFISAGCPLSVKMEGDKWPLIPDVAALTNHINVEFSTDKNYAHLLKELIKAGRSEKNVEDILSFLRSLLSVSRGGEVRGLDEASLRNLQHKICAVIVRKLNVQLPNQETPYHDMGNWVKSIDRKIAVEIFTTNYDILTELAFEDLQIPYFDGFVGTRRSFFDLRAVEDSLIPVHWSRVWKIHGSINWYQQTISGQLKVYRSSEIQSELVEGEISHLIYPSHLKYEESRKMPYLALIDQLTRFIRKKSSFLILCGYSFSDGHINDAIVNALKANPTAMVLGLMYENFHSESEGGVTVERYPEAYRLAKAQHNLNIWTYDKAIIGTNLGVWRSELDDSDFVSGISEFISKQKKADGQPNGMHLLKLGDFAQFASFLKRMIGSREVNND